MEIRIFQKGFNYSQDGSGCLIHGPSVVSHSFVAVEHLLAEKVSLVVKGLKNYLDNPLPPQPVHPRRPSRPGDDGLRHRPPLWRRHQRPGPVDHVHLLVRYYYENIRT